ncbi:MAG: hypothetical protein Q8R02_15130 [Hyphomonadaceae bacterium]|nr:hypothetical protein [Hyphomonadaceae bacterium]
MANEPEDELERLFASEEAAIRDDGFTQRVVEISARQGAWRRTAIYGAGMAGFGMAVGGIVEMSPYLPAMDFSGWTETMDTAARTVSANASLQGASDATLMAVAAVIAGVTCLIAAVAVQSR